MNTIDHNRLRDFATAVYAGEGVPELDARLLANTLVQADLWGHQSHGVLRLGWYFERLRNGVMKPVTQPEFITDAGVPFLTTLPHLREISIGGCPKITRSGVTGFASGVRVNYDTR